MSVKHLIAPGIGFSPGAINFIITRGLNSSPVEDYPLLTEIPLIFQLATETEADILAAVGFQGEPALASDTQDFYVFPSDGAAPVRFNSVLSDGAVKMIATITSDTTPSDDTSPKRMSLQKRSSPPSNAFYLEITGTFGGGDKLYLVFEEA